MAIKPANFIGEVVLELGRVEWPTRTQVVRLTAFVIVISVGVGLFIGGLDYVFVKITEILL
jgi:preprotein translocase SecE subunit